MIERVSKVICGGILCGCGKGIWFLDIISAAHNLEQPLRYSLATAGQKGCRAPFDDAVEAKT